MSRPRFYETTRQYIVRMEGYAERKLDTVPAWAERCGQHGNTPDYGCGSCNALIDRWTPINRPDRYRGFGAGGFHMTYDEEIRIHHQQFLDGLNFCREEYELAYQHMGHREKHPLQKPPPEPDYAGGRTCLVCGRHYHSHCKTCADVVQEEQRALRQGLATD